MVQWRNEDPSGNRSEYTQQYLLEFDQTKPQFFNVNSASSNKFNPIIDWKQNGQTTFYSDGRGNLPAITNQLDLSLNGTTEQLADVEYFLIDNQGQLANSQTLINGKDQKHTINFNLGDKTADRDGQIGLAQDGYYQICYNSADSSDNEIGTSCFVVQRDTLSPVTPNFSANLNFVYKNAPYTISGAVAGEPYTNSSLFGNLGRNGQRGGTLKTLDINNDSDWETTFTFCTNLTDRASNQSPSVCRSVSTPVRPPRDGECSLNDNQKSTIEDHIKNLTDPNSPFPDLNFTKSCQTYEPELIQSLVSREVDKVIDEINRENAKLENEAIEKQEKYAQELNNQANCLSSKFEEYGKNKGGSNNSGTEFNNWANDCGASDEVKNLEIEIDGKKVKLEDALKQGIDQVIESNKRGTMEGCKWDTPPWASNSCVANGIGEAIHHTTEFLGDVTAALLSPTTSLIQTAVSSALSGNWDNFPQKWVANNNEHFPIIQNNVSGVTKNTIHVIGRVGQAIPGIFVNLANGVSALAEGGVSCITGNACGWDNVGNLYTKNANQLQKDIGWNGGDWLGNINIISGTVVSLIGFGLGGPVGAIVAGGLFSYTLGSAQKGSALTLNEFMCEGKEGFDCNVNFVTNVAIDYLGGKLLESSLPKRNKVGVSDLLDGNKKPRTIFSEIDEIGGVPCLKVSKAPNSILGYIVAVFSPVQVDACGGGVPQKVNTYQNKFNNIKKGVLNGELEASIIESKGGSVGTNPKTGKPWDHITELQNSKRGLDNLSSDLIREINNPKNSAADVEAMKQTLSEVNTLLERVNSYLRKVEENKN